MADLFCRVIYRFWSKPLTFHLLSKALDAQYPSLLVKVKENGASHHLVALTRNSMLFILNNHHLATAQRSTLVVFTYAEYRDLEERLAAWRTSEPYARIQKGINQIAYKAAIDKQSPIRLRLPDDNAHHYTTTAYNLSRQAFMRGLMGCTHALWVVVYEDLEAARAYLPHEVKVLALEAA
jgi:hypothetical protein